MISHKEAVSEKEVAAIRAIIAVETGKAVGAVRMTAKAVSICRIIRNISVNNSTIHSSSPAIHSTGRGEAVRGEEARKPL